MKPVWLWLCQIEIWAVTVVAFLNGSFFSTIASAQESETLLARLKSEGVESWRIVDAADETPGTLKFTTTILSRVNDKVREPEKKEAIIERRPGYFLFKFERDGAKRIFGQNPDYRFELTHLPDKEGWQLGTGPVLSRPPHDQQIDPAIIDYLKPNGSSFIRLGGLVSKLMFAKDVKIIRAQTKASGVIQVHIEKTTRVPNLKIHLTGWLEFDPNNAWVMQGFQLTAANGTVVTLKKEFTTSGDGYRPCIRWEVKSENSRENSKNVRRTSYEIIDARNHRSAQFYVSAFGLPEPAGVSAPISRWYLWFIGIAAVSLIVGFYLLRRSKRPSATMPASGS
ncbi:MAG: hypothetical protein HYX68_09450 [Planctomycetes bacterium]|nr:hypothetical protein [Planctomycetota bacterium]